ncbi:ABC transporter permease [Thermobispora bispora]|uniref:Inner-membrane translocator n=1 Tax=Thermobispora bispora (strain ATCC 19993 / DSM 43833 / CBS 139.67 / JCM 10125 / KCTC 9307 / NBRC 14880 / R51) TaxID=469371 RepID=D6Y5Q9_THEBD|nr:ABC transporter permease [Thermobispora bispora]MBO2472746.1 ABC transporter permease [Actinomycetales bacterium]MDI9580027.1 ABC transporter permease [Thermobispora sp.]ADG87405.1 inner-membrane translocator [Thermobispora bispora DSM 43833]MBX6167858.1 ABC transporter permease [Thermobispora bispora]QSI47346.1 ABC transporter permease [Thermobispora bispora]
MTTTELPVAKPERAERRLRLNGPTLLLGIALLIVLLAVARVITGADDLTSAGTVGAALGLAVPIGLAGLGGLWSERAGVVNIGLEGMMILGTWFGAWGTLEFGSPWAGVIAGAIGGALGGVVHAIATVTFGVDHIISGVAINIVGLGFTQYLSKLVFEGMPGGGSKQSPRLPAMETLSVPWIGEPLRSLEASHTFLVSDVAGVLLGITQNVPAFTLLAILLVPLSYFLLWRTAFGLRLRACGERPVAAESLGVNVYLYKWIAVVVSGLLAGLGGAFLSIVAAQIYRDGQTGGRGYIGLAAMIFGNWRPGGLAGGAALFGYTDALQLRQGGVSVHALLLVITLLLAAVAVYHAVRRRRWAALISGAAAVVIFVAFTVTDVVPEQFTSFTPHLTTLLVLALASQRLRMPAADGVPYRRGQTT